MPGAWLPCLIPALKLFRGPWASHCSMALLPNLLNKDNNDDDSTYFMGLYRGLNNLITPATQLFSSWFWITKIHIYERHLVQYLEHSKSTKVFAVIASNQLPDLTGPNSTAPLPYSPPCSNVHLSCLDDRSTLGVTKHLPWALRCSR